MINRLIVEVHRRSLWQVLTIYAVGSWVALQVVEALTNSAGLPDWVPGFALVLLILGLPIVLATAFVQEGLPGSGPDPAPRPEVMSAGGAAAAPIAAFAGPERAEAHHRIFTWRHAVLGGVAAFALLGVAVTGYFAMRITGVGPAASLAAQGVFEEREPILLAAFGNATADSSLGGVVTEALRVDLLETTALTLLAPSAVADALRRTGRAPDALLTPDVAREIAVRDGIKAVVKGDVGEVGSSYVLTAAIVEPASGAPLASFREAAAGESDLLAAIDRLSQKIREKAGESLRSIKAGEPLSAVTTSSLEALRAYTQARRLSDSGDREGAVRLLQEAIDLDPSFAMAHRGIAVELFNLRSDRSRMEAAATRAYELRDRLPTVERHLAAAFYHSSVRDDRRRAADAYRQLLAIRPDHPAALNNLSLILGGSKRDVMEAVQLLERAVTGTGATMSAYNNLVMNLWHLRRDGEIDPVIRQAQQRYPDSYFAARMTAHLLAAQGQDAALHATVDSLLERFSANAFAEFDIRFLQAAGDLGRGRLREARTHLAEAARLAREQEQAAWKYSIGTMRGEIELLLGGGPEAARRELRELERDVPLSSGEVHFAGVANVAALATRAGDGELTRRARSALEDMAPEGRSSEYEAAVAYAEWASALAREDGATALRAAQSMERHDHESCDGRRCYGAHERGMALEQLGRNREAIAAYEEQLAGLPFGQGTTFAILRPWLLERLAELYDREGEPARAVEYYARFAELWKDADTELQPRVQRARSRAAALLAARG